MANEDDYYRKRAVRRLGALGILIVVVGGGVWYLASSGDLQKIASFENSAELQAVQTIADNFSAPPPLVMKGPGGNGAVSGGTGGSASGAGSGSGQTGQYALTRAGIIAQTNAQRSANGRLQALSENTSLDEIASIRLNDMFAKQYFAHVSPASSSAQTVAKQVNYQYLEIGENLALGDFDGDKGVVDAWMGSPGHRANILNTHYTEIGVAAKEGVYQGEPVWIAVQIFGRPASDCPMPDPNLKAEIDNDEAQLTQMQSQLQSAKADIDATSQDDPGYNQKVDAYNSLATQYNTLLSETKAAIAGYNSQASAFNICLNQ